jgi:hypothetical protein
VVERVRWEGLVYEVWKLVMVGRREDETDRWGEGGVRELAWISNRQKRPISFLLDYWLGLWSHGVMELWDESKTCSSSLRNLSGIDQESEASQRLISYQRAQCNAHTKQLFSNSIPNL